MKHDPLASGKRKAVNLSLDTGVVAAAREAGLNLSQICEAALREAAKKERDRRWAEENRAWAEEHNRWVEENDLPLEHHRLF
ncbi:type II toxin-antitoxin system CcdA family antitoxin [Sphingomonas hengshuiensis]|uniref:Post-segregation antitoxin CcdA n=1 Tax=Sphingomonas hengshuiensis TaxID=1609977 RepID=A0A7U4JB85_9SPHN|nr:type II toxin-antitoxin system CcdA family antitoxin [Sphingomonas hengshuiensis]AJP73631.1 post-segregation antitoxin CcdA [Sphingomonas hengshuiensis]